ncbi:2-oxoacid:acceptor oxidoreductase subunit alpha [Candidatus Roizmanbacteria bacterium]|nr:2-oxoacid:acceptor oxidoreductase subunit alpha [Candidatus Roizmanbacteria bacterium]
MKFTWKIGGEAGFGILTSGVVFSKIANRNGYFTFDYIEYPSLIRGGHNALEVVASEEEVRALQKDIDFLVCLNQDTFKFHQHRLTPKSYVLYDSDEFTIQETNFIKIAIPFKKILSDLKGQLVMKNTIAIGASLSILGSDLIQLNKIIEEQFARKGQEVIDFNKKFAQLGFDYVKQNYTQHITSYLSPRKSDQKVVMTGNDAFALASVISDCRVYSAYPMTPSSTVLTTLAAWQKTTGMVVRHAEDEISVINTALGASFAGVRAAVGTSGGGFALMVESVSLAGIAEIPIVIFLSQRAGPATGMPTWTEQGDILFAVHAGHGEFPKMVFAPGDIEEMLELTAKAFNIAEIYQTPVIILSDMFLSESHKSVSQDFINKLAKNYKVDNGKVFKPNGLGSLQERYLRYKLTEDGISPRLIPGAKGHFYQANSYEHVEDGHTTEDAQARKQQVEKRNKKWDTYLSRDFEAPKTFGDLDSAEIVFVSWGSTKGPVLEAQKLLKQDGIATALIHFTHVYPMKTEDILPLFKDNKRYVLVENNSHSQFGKLLRMETGIDIKEKLLKYDGRPFWPEEIVNFINSTK